MALHPLHTAQTVHTLLLTVQQESDPVLHRENSHQHPSLHPSAKSETHPPDYPCNRLFIAGAPIVVVAVLFVVVPLQAQNTCVDRGFEGVPVRYAGDVLEAALGIGEFAF